MIRGMEIGDEKAVACMYLLYVDSIDLLFIISPAGTRFWYVWNQRHPNITPKTPAKLLAQIAGCYRLS